MRKVLLVSIFYFSTMFSKYIIPEVRYVFIRILKFATIDLFRGKCRARSACTYVQADRALHSPPLSHYFLSVILNPMAFAPIDIYWCSRQQLKFHMIRVKYRANNYAKNTKVQSLLSFFFPKEKLLTQFNP